MLPSFLAALSDRRPRGLLLWILVSILGSACVEGIASPGEKQGVLLVVVDGLRADHVGAISGPRPTTPRLDALASEGLVFADAIAAAPLLQPAHIGILTGSAPELARKFYRHESGEARWDIKPRIPHLAVEFLGAGYQTAAFLDRSTLAPSEGFARGFQEFLRLDDGVPSAERITRHAQRLEDWLNSLGEDQAWFAYLHLADLERSWTDPLEPWDGYFKPPTSAGMYDVPPVGTTDASFFALPHSRWRGRSRSLGEYVASYDGHLRRLDQELGAIFARLRTLGLDQSTTVVVVGSYGMQFGEAGLYLSSGLYSMADLHVPWIIRPRQGQQQAAPGTRVEQVVSLLDLAPTLLEMEGLPIPAGMHGISQAAHLKATPPSKPLRREAFASSGTIEGFALVGERYVVEMLRPASLQNRTQRLSWNGVDSSAEAPDAIRYYDRVQSPFPSLGPYQHRVGQAQREFLARQRRAFDWAANVFGSRSVLQRGSLWGQPVAPERVEELMRLGYLGSGR